MPIILDPIPAPPVSPSGEIIDCDWLSVVEVGESYHEGCIISSKTRIAVVQKGQDSVIRWTLRPRDGKTVDLSNCPTCEVTTTDDPSTTAEPCEQYRILVRFMDPLGCNNPAHIPTAEGVVVDVDTGAVMFSVPKEISDNAGIYLMSIALMNPDGKIISIDSGMLSVEHSLWGNWEQSTGPPTIQEIRLQLRDSLVENDLLADVEFDDTEIIHSIIRPIQQWNELPPPVAFYRPSNFPHKYHWTQAVCGNLLRIAAAWYRRNHLPSIKGSLQIDDRNKAPEYSREADRLQAEWLKFVRAKKVEYNIRGAYGVTGSDYGRLF
jgi:hypothetical protein